MQNLPGLETSKTMAKVCWLTVFSYVLSLVFIFFLLSGFLLRLFCCGVFLTSSGSETKTMAMKTWGCWSNRTLKSASSCFSSSSSLVFLSVFFFLSPCLSLPLCNVCLSLSSLFSSSVSLCFSRLVPPWFFLCLLLSVFPGFFCSFLSHVLGVSVFLYFSPSPSFPPV